MVTYAFSLSALSACSEGFKEPSILLLLQANLGNTRLSASGLRTQAADGSTEPVSIGVVVYATISVPIPLFVKISRSSEWGMRPSMK
jgi:hypothetical protein